MTGESQPDQTQLRAEIIDETARKVGFYVWHMTRDADLLDGYDHEAAQALRDAKTQLSELRTHLESRINATRPNGAER